MAKLVEILARELNEWPMACGGTYRTEAIAQDLDGGLVRLDHLKEPHPTQFNGEDWSRGCWTGYGHYVELSEDHATAIVTRTEWQAAVDALYPKLVVAEEWDGVGLPPVGTVVRSAAVGNPFFEAFRDMDLQVVFHDHNQDGEPIAVFRYPDPEESMEVEDNGEGYASWLYHGMVSGMFRPVRTPEQIAVEKREAGIESIRQLLSNVACDDFHAAVAIYDAGYRKQEPK